MSLEIEIFQEEVDKLTHTWSDQKLELLMYLTEEVGELARAIRKAGAKRWGHDHEAAGSPQDIVEELGDVLFLLARISLISDVDLSDAASTVLKKVEERVSQSG